MRYNFCITILFLSMLPSVTFSQKDEDESSTHGWANGRYWVGLSLDAKIQHLYGIEAGINLFAEELKSKTKTESEWNRVEELRKKLMIGGFRFSDVAQQVDKFFEDRSNIRIPVDYAYLYSVRKMSGESPSQLEYYLASLRKQWNN